MATDDGENMNLLLLRRHCPRLGNFIRSPRPKGVTQYENCAASTTRRWRAQAGAARKNRKSDPDGTVVAKARSRSSLPVIIMAWPTTVIRILFSAGFFFPALLRRCGYGARLQALLDDDR